MDLNPDFNDRSAALNAAGARYLVVGGYAVFLSPEPDSPHRLPNTSTSMSSQRVPSAQLPSR